MPERDQGAETAVKARNGADSASGAGGRPDKAGIAPAAFMVFIMAHALLLLALMAAGRLAMVLAFAEPGLLAADSRGFWAMWRTGLLFDLRTAAIALLPLYLAGLAACVHGPAARICSIAQKAYSPILYALVALAAATSFYYYRTFHNEIDVFIFGLADDDTKAIFANITNDYPIIRIGLLAAGAVCLCSFLTGRVWRGVRRWTPGPRGGRPLKAAMLLIFTAAYVLGMRGSVTTFPLRQNDMMVADVPLLNKAVPNGLMAFSWAYKNYCKRVDYQPASRSEGRALALAAIGRGELTDRTGENAYLAERPPHVVLAIMESFGTNLLKFDQAGVNDLLGSLRRHSGEDFLFLRFLPEENGTMPSLMALLYSCPDQAVTLGTKRNTRLDGGAFDAFKENGYETAFIYPGRGSWCNIGPYLAAQKTVDRIYDQNYLVKRYGNERPDIASEADAWGLPDEYAFRLARQLLEESAKPLFIVILTITNHPPYAPLPRYRPFPIAPDAELLARLDVQESAKRDLLLAYQYANSCLGDFISAVKDGPLGDRVVIAATGDHRVRDVKAEYPADLLLEAAVPFYLRVPRPILDRVPHRYAPDRPGSHKDIMPTLYALSLSDAAYYSVGGRNLLAETDDPARAFGYNVQLFIDAEGVCVVDAALKTRHAYGGGLRADETPQPMPAAAAGKIDAFGRLRRWQINARMAGLRD